jgi:signal transduction histidine kinase
MNPLTVSLPSSVPQARRVAVLVAPQPADAKPGKMVAPSGLQRYTFAVVAGCIALILRLSIGWHQFYDLSFLAPFVAVVAAAIFGGWGPGLLATAILATAVRVLPLLNHAQPAAVPLANPGLKLLIEGGVLLSLVGGEVFAARRRTRASDLERLDLERKVLEISDEERRRIGHDLHDGLGQHLTGISLLSASLAQRIEAGSIDTARDAEKISQLVAQTIGWTRDLARGLSPVTLESDGLLAALEELTGNAQSLLEIECFWRCEGRPPQLDRQSALHIFRIVQEAISNSVKHGKAKTVHVSLITDDRTLTVKIIDDGKGISAKTKANPGLGLRIMNYRARMVGATLSVDRAGTSGGTMVICRCRAPAEAPI